MKLDYEYFVHQTTPSGYSTVEYCTPELGSITRYMFLPYDVPGRMHQKIMENFPLHEFYGRWLETQKVPIPEGFSGSFSVDFSDSFFDIVNEATRR